MTNQINNFYLEFNKYIDFHQKIIIKEQYNHVYLKLRKIFFKNKLQRRFVKDYKHLNKFVDKYNKKYVDSKLDVSILNNINGCKLDINQKKLL